MMQKTLLGITCFLTFEMQALEYQIQFENDQVRVAKVKILGHEEIGFHRDAYPQVIVATLGGTITRLESDGRAIDVVFPTGASVFKAADPEGELHRSVNNTDDPVELVVVQLKG